MKVSDSRSTVQELRLLQIKAYQVDTKHGMPINIPEPPRGYEDYDEVRLHFADPQGMLPISYENFCREYLQYHYTSENSNVVSLTDRIKFQQELQTLNAVWNERKHAYADMDRNRYGLKDDAA